MRIIYNGRTIKKCDKRFSKKLWLEGSDYRVGTKKRTTKPLRAKYKVFIKWLQPAFVVYGLSMILLPYVLEAQKIVKENPITPVEAIAPRDEIPRERPLTIEEKIKKVFGNKGDEAVKVFTCESGLNPNAVSRTFDIGVAQVNYKVWNKTFGQNLADYQDVDKNLNMAKYIYDLSGNFRAWSSSKSCHGYN